MKKVYIDKNPQELNKVRKELRDKVQKHTELQVILNEKNLSEEVIDRNLALLADYADSLDEVKECRKNGKCLHNGAYHALRLEVDGPFLTLVPEPCIVYNENTKSLLGYIFQDFPQEYSLFRIKDNPRRRGFAKFTGQLVSFYKKKINLIYACSFTENASLRYAVSFLNQILDEETDSVGAVINYPSFLRDNASDFYKQKETLANLLEQLINVDYLIITDFGNEERSRNVRDAFTFPLLSERIGMKKPTIILSALTLENLQSLYYSSGRDLRIQQIVDLIRKNISEELFLEGISL